jgi:PAS domain S-box-containing protein
MTPLSKTTTIFAGVALITVASILLLFSIDWKANAQIADDDIHRIAISHLRAMLLAVADAETAQRGFLLTGDDHFLIPYQQALVRIPMAIRSLNHDADVPRPRLSHPDVDELTRLIQPKVAEMAQVLDIRRTQGLNAAIALVKNGSGIQQMELIRARAQQLMDREELSLRAGLADEARWNNTRVAIYGVAGIIDLGFLLWAYRRLTDESIALEATARDLAREKDLLQVTLASIADGVIVTNLQGRITFINEVAQSLTGWSNHEALGQPCNRVFNAASEQTHNLLPSAVDKILRDGHIVGLADDTILIRRDGTEVSIDPSGAPIREPDGTVRGVVLVFRDFTERRGAEGRLLKAKSDLEAAGAAKDQFIATLSHELRTPLTPVLALLSTWLEDDRLPPALHDDVQMLRRNVELEARLIDDLLDVTRIVQGKLTLNKETTDVHQLLRGTAEMYRSEINAKSIRMSMRLEAGRHHVQADPARLQQVFWNILKNAIKFSHTNGSLQVATETGPDGKLQITFVDDGIGMSPETLKRLFAPFEQGAQEIGQRYGGLGLGMAISKALVDAHGGDLSATSEGPGHGSSFTLAIPSVDTSAAPHPNATSANSESPPARQLEILLVEDHADTAFVMTRLLRKLGHNVQTSETVASAVRLAAENEFDLLLSDIGLPDGNGIDLIRQLRRGSTIPAVALTGFGMDSDVVKCREAGFDAHLTKPVNFQKLEVLIRDLTDHAADRHAG